MPFQSEEQRKFMWAKHPDIARNWTNKYGSSIKRSNVQKLAKDMIKKRAAGQVEKV